jgi:hypothetical protein
MINNVTENGSIFSNYREELLQVFPNSKVFFDLSVNNQLDTNPIRPRTQQPLFVTINEDSAYCFVKCEEYTLKEIFNMCKQPNEKNIDGIVGWSDNEIEIFNKNLELLHGKEMARYLLNLSIDVRLKFNAYHHSKHPSGRIRCCVFCEKERENNLKKALQISLDYANNSFQKRSKENFEAFKFGKEIELIKTKHYSIFKMDLILAYDLFNYGLIAFRSEMLDKNAHILDLTK